MNKVNVALFFAALLVIGACAEPRKLLANTEVTELAAAEEHQRILAELEEVHQLRERMLQQGKSTSSPVQKLNVSTCLGMKSCNSTQDAIFPTVQTA